MAFSTQWEPPTSIQRRSARKLSFLGPRLCDGFRVCVSAELRTFPASLLSPEARQQIFAFLVETGSNAEMREENMKTQNVAELVAVANRYGFAFTPADTIRHQSTTILGFSDEELSLYTQSGPWWGLCLEAYARYGK